MKKNIKTALIVINILFIIFALVYGGMLWRKMIVFNKGSELMSSGSYAEAKAQFEKIGDSEKIAQCDEALKLIYLNERLERANELMESGQLEDAKVELVILGDFGTAPELLLECEYRMVLALKEEGSYSEAMQLLRRLEEHPDAAAQLEEIQELLYQQALQLAYECRLDEAMPLFTELGDYKDSKALYRRCSDRIVNLLSDWAEPVNYSEYAGMNLGSGTLYWHRIGLVYVPHEAGPETSAMIFFPGGYDQSLANGYMTDYLYGYYGALPNSLMVFCYANGYGSFDIKAEDAYNVLEQAAMENDIFIHDLALIGASNGAYTAAHTAAWLYENKGIAPKHVVTLDAGQHWESFMPVLSTEECDLLAKAGTSFTLVEGDGVGMNKLAIQTMVAHRMDVTIAHVRDYGHYSVIYDAMKYGIFNWAMGEGDRPEHDNYRYIKLDKNSTYPD